MRWRELRPCVLGCGCSPEHRLLHQGVTWSGGAQPLQSLQSLHACMQTLFPTLHQQVAWVPTLDNHSVRMMRCESFNHVTVLSDGHLFFSPWLFLLSAWSLSSVVCAPALFGPTFYFWSCVCVCVHARVCEYLPCSWFCFWFSLDSAFLSSVSVSLTCYVEPPPPHSSVPSWGFPVLCSEKNPTCLTLSFLLCASSSSPMWNSSSTYLMLLALFYLIRIRFFFFFALFYLHFCLFFVLFSN